MEAPPGGPPDTKKPYVSAVFPAPDSTHVSREIHFKIAFSEWVNTDIERGRVYLNPPLSHKLKTKLTGNVLDITSASELDTGTTYTLGLLGSVKDLNGLPLESPFELTFTTGSKLDSGSLSGRVIPFQGKVTAGSFVALYPRGLELRSHFQTLTYKGSEILTVQDQPNPKREKPAYIAPADSLGRFHFKSVRPGYYAVLGFQDINANLNPEIGTEAIAAGPTVEVSRKEEIRALSLIAYDTVPLKLLDAKWKSEIVRGNLSDGTLHLKFNHPLHPVQALSANVYGIKKQGAKKLEPVRLLDICMHPQTGEIEIHPEPLAMDSEFVISVTGLKDVYGNDIDTSHAKISFKVGKEKDTTKIETVFFGPRKINGEQEKIGMDNLIPSRGFGLYYPHLLNDSTWADLKSHLVVKADTTPLSNQFIRINHHEFAIQFPQIALKAQRLSISLKSDTSKIVAKDSSKHDSTKTPINTALPMGVFTLADSSHLGSLKFKQDASAYGSRIVLRSLFSPQEYSRTTPLAEEFSVDSLPEGFYAVDYFRDANGDGLWNPGSLMPWNVQEPYVQLQDSVEVKSSTIGTGKYLPNQKLRKLAWPPTW